jgi:DNA-binding response OmpR family regulator
MSIRGPVLNGMEALVVEESPSVAALLAEILADHGARVTVACDPFHAMGLLRSGRYDLVTVEADAIGRGQPRVLEYICTRRPDLAERTLAITAYRYDRQFMSFLGAMQIPCIAKPFDLDELLDCCRRLVTGGPKAAA